MNLFHRKVQPWEVVEQQSVDAVPMFTGEERQGTCLLSVYSSWVRCVCSYPAAVAVTGLDIVEVYDATMSGVYVFELKKAPNLRGAVAFARKTLLQEAAVKGYNVFLSEGYVVAWILFPRMR